MLALLKIFICYTLPLQKDANCFHAMREAQFSFATVFLKQVGLCWTSESLNYSKDGLLPLMELISESLTVDSSERNKQQSALIELYLNFIRNLLAIRVMISAYTDTSSYIDVCA